jgi:hypothetical protein
MSDLLALAERVAVASGPDRELDADVYEALGGALTKIRGTTKRRLADRYNGRDVPRYTASIDAALTLVPEGWLLDQVGENWRTGAWTARLAERASPKLIEAFDAGRVIGRESEEGEAATPALALVAAALRARAAT